MTGRERHREGADVPGVFATAGARARANAAGPLAQDGGTGEAPGAGGAGGRRRQSGTGRASGGKDGGWSGDSYYGMPPLKNAQWDWKVSGYIAVAGMAGAAQALAAIGTMRDADGFRGARRTGDLLALGGSATGAALLIADLKTPRRFYNMLRILRPTSPMSIGTYVLGAFGLTSAVAALAARPAQPGPVLRGLGGAARAGAALGGAGAATYTAALMSATSNPYWAAAPHALGAQFAASSVASGAAALALGDRAGGRDATAARLERVALVAGLVHLAAGLAAKRRRRETGVAQAVAEQARRETADMVLSGALPLAAHALATAAAARARSGPPDPRPAGTGQDGGRPGAFSGQDGRDPRLARTAAVAGGVAMIAGAFLFRHGVLRTGKSAARDPAAAFALAQPRNLPPSRPRKGEPG